MSQLDRQVLFGNEAFAIGVLQVVSGAAAVAAISQIDKLIQLAGRNSVLAFITLVVATLVLAVLAAYFRHQYKMWDVKAQAAYSVGDPDLGKQRSDWANRDLGRMRRAMTTAVVTLCIGFFELVVFFWM